MFIMKLCLSMLFIEDDMLSGGTLSPVLLDLGKGHKSDGDAESPPSASQVINNNQSLLYLQCKPL